MMRLDVIKQYSDDKDLLEDVIIENKQAIDMSQTYGNILNGTMGVVGSIISNNLNIVMKVLTSLTIILAIPTIVASFMGMNVPVPLADNPLGFLTIILITIVITAAFTLFMLKKKLF